MDRAEAAFERRVQDRLAVMHQMRDLNASIHKQQSYVHHVARSQRDPFARLSPKSAEAIKRFNVVRDLPEGDSDQDKEDRKVIANTVDRLAGAGVRSPSPKRTRKPTRGLTIDVIRWALKEKYITIKQVKAMIDGG